MSGELSFILDGREVSARAGQTIIEAADEAGVYIPRLCHRSGLEPFGGCRVCTVTANGRHATACTLPVGQGMVVETDTEELTALRKQIVEMLFVSGNHFCMFCERSGNCELQALAYRLGITAPRYPFLCPERKVDASHPDILIDHNRCILCSRCVRASIDLDGKRVFGFVGRGPERRISVNGDARLASTDADVTDQALDACPVGALLRKREGFREPVGTRRFDHEPIGTDVESRPEEEK
jgi:[NiFe] hydrogenase diaphorase moiety small subunit